MPSQQTNSAIRLPSVLAIGFTGHRSLADEPRCRELLRTYLREKQGEVTVYGVSSVAAGGDLLFAETCIELGIPLRVLLPLPAESFREDFDREEWARVERVLGKAVGLDVVSGCGRREEAYYDCGIETVQQSQILIALWDGEPSRGPGGTEDIKSFAEAMGKPVIWLHADTGSIQVLNPEALRDVERWRDPELEFLGSLPDRDVSLKSGSQHALAEAWLQKLDENASRMAPQVQRLSSIPIVYTATAAFISGAGLQMPHPDRWIAMGTALGITAALLPVALRLARQQSKWARTRTAAEVSRSVLALWSARPASEAVEPEMVPELAGMLMSLHLMRMIEGVGRRESIEEFKTTYRGNRVACQIEYFVSHSRKSARQARVYTVVSWVCTGMALAFAVWLIAARAGFAFIPAYLPRIWIAVAVPALFQFATILGALLIVKDCKRRQRRYGELGRLLEVWDKELASLRTWPTVLKVVHRIERALLVELLEWKSLVRNVKLPGK